MNKKLINRYSFGKIKDRGEMPNFLEFQLDSYEDFLQTKATRETIENKGLEAIFQEVFPIESVNGNLKLEYLGYEIHENEEPLNDELECKKRGKTYSGQLKVNLRLTNNKTEELKETLVHFGDIPLMTDKATFIINGAERVVVSQLHRSPGITFNKELNLQTGKDMFIGKIIPYKGTWLEFETDKNDVLNVKIDRKKKVLVSQFLKAIGFFKSNREILDEFFEIKTVDINQLRKKSKNDTDLRDILKNELEGSFLNEELVNMETGEALENFKVGTYIDVLIIDEILNSSMDELKIWEVKPEDRMLALSLKLDHTTTIVEGAREVFKKLKPGDIITDDSSVNLVNQMFFNTQRYDLAPVGRYKINKRLKIQGIGEQEIVLTKKDIVETIKYLKVLYNGSGNTDDIDNLSNRRVRGVGELLAIQIKGGVSKMSKMVREKMQTQDINTLTPQSLLNTKPLSALISEFFGSGQLSQFMDQSNPLSELTHKRRISALGPGGLSRDRAGFEVRDVHNSHYGRVCPIETPEGPNIGLIASLSTYGKVNKYGFIETPFVKVKNGVADFEDIQYLAADEEEGLFIAQADTHIDEKGNLLDEEVTCRYGEEIVNIDRHKVDLMDVSPKQIVSVSAALIPFLEHDDANRALMGSNMQRQAVPLLKTEAPFVGTGLERKVAIDSGAVLISKVKGKVTYLDASKIVITDTEEKEHIYKLLNFEKSNQSMCLHQKPIVDLGDEIEVGDILADGPSTAGGDLALGKNILLAFMPWEGYNFEDGILISERLRKDDVFTSLHIEEFEIEARTTKLGEEEITREIPNVSEEALKNLDKDGIIRVGAYVEPDDILVGKVTPKGETEPPAEERLLRAIFGEKAKDVRDTSLRLPHGIKGTVVDVLVLSKDKDELKAGVNKTVRVYVAEKRKIMVGDKMSGRHGNKGVVSRVLPVEDMPHLEDGTPIDVCLNPLGVPSRMNIGQVLEVHLGLAVGDMNKYIATPVFDGAKEEDVKDFLEKAGYPRTGKIRLIDGRTGEYLDNPVNVGRMYMLKLHHLVEDKMHARAIGPYSLVTQQPLGGKAQFGGQRLGEMEVWALEAYGASNILQEMLTVKSDDINGRTKTYESIIKGQAMPEADAPESFKVLVKEFQALGLDVNLYNKIGEKIELDNNFEG